MGCYLLLAYGVAGGLELKHMVAMTKPWDGAGASPECGSFLFTALPTVTYHHDCHMHIYNYMIRTDY